MLNNTSIISILIFCINILFSSEYYVATFGSDNNPGSFISPFRTIQQAADIMVAGDICYIRQGTYHETVTVNDKDGIDGYPIIFSNYNNEKVLLDGTVPIETIWETHSNGIWKTTLDFDIWQLFLDRKEILMARWPNANIEDGSIWNKDDYWGHGTIDQDDEAYDNGTLIDEPHSDINLATIGFDITDAVAILNVGSFKTWTRRVNSHNGNTFTYDTVPDWKVKHHDYYLEGKLEFLDSENEWFFNPETKELYYYPPNDLNPNTLDIRGKVQSYAFEIYDSDFITIQEVEFFGTTFKYDNSDYGLIDRCNLFYSNCYKRMLGIIDTVPDITIFTSSSYCKVVRSSFRYTDGSALEMYSGDNTIEDCYFYHIDHTATDLNGLMTSIQMGGSDNIFRNNTLHKLGASATLNPGNAALIELNDMSDSGYMQSDGSLVQCMTGQQPNVEIRYNWLHDTIKYGARFDGNGEGNNGLMHHNVIWNVQGGIMIKGFEHNLFNNTAFDNGDKNDIIVMIEQGGNEGTFTQNNAANKIAGHRSGTYQDYPVPGIYSNNWNGYETNDNIKNHLIDPDNYDFRPHPDSALVDAGINIDGITDDYIGVAPDQGAYEYGGDIWIPGITWNLEETFGDEFTEPMIMHNGPIWYVATTGSNNNDGSLERPFATIQFAIERASENDTILVQPGTYFESNWLYSKNIVLASLFITTNDTSYINNTIIDGDSTDCTLAIYGNIDSTCKIIGFTIQNGIGCVYGQGGGIYIEGSNPTLENLIIKNNSGGTNGGGICLNSNSNALINNVLIENNSSEYGGGIACFNSEPTLKNCTIKNNHASYNGGGLYLEMSNPILKHTSILMNSSNNEGGGLYIMDGDFLFINLSIINNIANNGGGLYYENNNDNINPIIKNSILWDNIPQSIINLNNVSITYSNIQGGWEGIGNIDLDPLFCLIDSSDYTLAENSPCVDTADPNSPYDENNTIADMGAFGIGCEQFNFSPSEFSLSTPDNNSDIIIDEYNLIDNSISFSWEASSDLNNDSLIYLFRYISSEINDFSVDTNVTNFDISYLDFYNDLFENNISLASITWNVSVTDGIDTIMAENAPYTINIDINNALNSFSEKLIPKIFSLHQNYPNPFNPKTIINYDLPNNAMVQIKIYDILGRKIISLVNNKQKPGYHSIEWNATNDHGSPIPAGIYFYMIQADNFIQMKKMILLK